MQVLTNHVGFAATSAKRAIVQHDVPLQAQPFSVVDLRSRAVVFGGVTTPVAPVAGWRGRPRQTDAFLYLQVQLPAAWSGASLAYQRPDR